MEINHTVELRRALRYGPYAWPGGYPLYFVADDGAPLSFDAVRNNYRLVSYSVRHKIDDGWRVVGVGVNWEDPDLRCADTGERIQSAYAEEYDR